MGRLARAVWEWPDGLVWKVTEPLSVRSRRAKYALFLRETRPVETDTILDVGATDSDRRAANPLEYWYPHKERITACGIEDLAAFRKAFPEVRVVRADGRRLPFKDREFRIVFSNATIEHVGTAADLAAFAAELCRVGEKVFCTTPAKSFPFEPHTLIPFAHWLPLRLRDAVYRMLGRGYWASEERLRPLSVREFRSLFAKTGRRVRILRTRTLGLTATLVAVVD